MMRRTMIPIIALGVVASLMLAACGGGNSAQPSNSPTEAPWPDTFVSGAIAAMNDTKRRVPSDFYFLGEEEQTEHEYFHVRSDQVWPASTMRYDVATQDPYEAAAWASEAVARLYPTAVPLTQREEAWYYEFDWSYQTAEGETHIVSARVFNSARIDRSVHDDWHPGSLLAVLATPFSANDAAWISEYLWTFSTYNNAGHVVLQSDTVADANEYRHTIREAVYDASYQGSACLDVAIWDNVYHANRNNGALTWERILQGTFAARLTAQGYAPCQSTGNTPTEAGIQQVYPE